MKYLDTLKNQLINKTPINKISTRSLGLEFKSDNLIKSRARKLLLKKCCLIIINNESLLSQL